MPKTKELFAQRVMKTSKKEVEQKKIKELMESGLNEEEARNFLKKTRTRIKRMPVNMPELFPCTEEEKEKYIIEKSVKEISASKIATYRGCPLAYYYQYIKHIKVPSPPSKVFGKEIHFMIESFHTKKFKSSESFLNFWKHRWWSIVNEEYSDGKIDFKSKGQAGYFFDTGKKILEPFYEHNKKLPKPILCEEDLSKYDISLNGVKLIGKLDRVDEIDGKIIITDYKTDFLSPADDTFLLHRLPQFTFYALVWKLKYGKIPHLDMHHLRSGQAFKTRRTEGDFEYLQDLVNKTVKRIKEGDFTPFYGFHCKFCEFKDPACKMHCVGLDSKLKKLEEEFQTEPEIDERFSYEVPTLKVKTPENIAEYVNKGDFKSAYFALGNHLRNIKCPIALNKSLACTLWDEESSIRLPD